MHRSFKKIVTLILTAGMILCSSTGFAAPQGGRVVAGSATINQQNTATVINQGSNRAIINWNSFDIGKQESVQHNMPSAQSAGLHRVVGGGGASQIAGKLQSNGNIYLVNPAGVTIHKGARVQTNSFTATSRDISNENFMKGNIVFDKPGRPDAKIINEGTITVSENGLAALVGPTVRNDGVIAGKLGKVVLASGDSTYKLDMHGDELITFTVDEQAVNTLYAPDGTPLSAPEAKNAGTIKTEGGVVVLTASQLDGIVGQVVNTGHIEAGGISLKGKGNKVDVANTGTLNASNTAGNGGSVRLTGEAKVTAAGTIEARGSNKGGKVVATGREVAVAANTKIDASGSQGGGIILIGGNYQGQGPERNAEKTSVAATAEIKADATAKGDGGQVVVWSDGETTFDGAISARGGSEGGDGGNVETSGKILKIGDAAWVNTSALNGSFGTWLLDPVDFVVAADGGDITGAALSQNLELGNVVIKSSNGISGVNGDIYIRDEIYWESPSRLTLSAHRSVEIYEPITATNDNAGLILASNTGWNPDITLPIEQQFYHGNIWPDIYIWSTINLTGSNPYLMIAGKELKVINSINDLQNINNRLDENYALGSDIDATMTKYWNNGLGFQPIGSGRVGYETEDNAFTGYFNGLGHKITNLTINRPNSDFVGLFGLAMNAHIGNVAIENANIIGNSLVGSIVGEYFSVHGKGIYGSYSTGSVTGESYVGGFAGRLFGGAANKYVNIRNCFTTCSVNKLSENSHHLGGFISAVEGTNTYVILSYSLGNVENANTVGGFASVLSESAYVNNCYYNGDSAGVAHNGIAIRSNSTNMMQQSEYSRWDFRWRWAVDEGNSYPVPMQYSAPSRNPYLANNNSNPGGNDPQNPVDPNGGGNPQNPANPNGGGGYTIDGGGYVRMGNDDWAWYDSNRKKLYAHINDKAIYYNDIDDVKINSNKIFLISRNNGQIIVIDTKTRNTTTYIGKDDINTIQQVNDSIQISSRKIIDDALKLQILEQSILHLIGIAEMVKSPAETLAGAIIDFIKSFQSPGDAAKSDFFRLSLAKNSLAASFAEASDLYISEANRYYDLYIRSGNTDVESFEMMLLCEKGALKSIQLAENILYNNDTYKRMLFELAEKISIAELQKFAVKLGIKVEARTVWGDVIEEASKNELIKEGLSQCKDTIGVGYKSENLSALDVFDIVYNENVMKRIGEDISPFDLIGLNVGIDILNKDVDFDISKTIQNFDQNIYDINGPWKFSVLGYNTWIDDPSKK